MTNKQAIKKVWDYVVLSQFKAFHVGGYSSTHSSTECSCMMFLARLRRALDSMVEDIEGGTA